MTRRRALLAVLLALAPLASPAAAAGPPPRVGGYAPSIDLADVSGKPLKIGWGEGSPAATIIYFFDPQSPNCLLQMSFLDSLYARARDFGLAVYAVEGKGRQPGEVSRMMERYCALYREPAFPVLPDPAFRASRTFGVQLTPTTFVAESHGVILNRIEGYDHGTAVAVTRRVEQLLQRDRGYFSSALRDGGVNEAEEREIGERLAAEAAESGRTARALGPGDRAPSFEIADLAGRTIAWGWPQPAGLPRVAFFWGGLSLPSIEAMVWLDSVARRARDVGLDMIAIEAGGTPLAGVQDALEKYRRLNPALSFAVAADPEKNVVRLFGPWEELPQTYLLAPDGTVVYHASGFDRTEAATMTDKIERAFLIAGRPIPSERGGETTVSPGPTGGEEAPSVKARREKEERYRSGIVQGDTAFMAWDYAKALPNFLDALALQPDDLHALVRAAQCYDRLGDPAHAVEYWRRVLRVSPDHGEARTRLQELQPTP